LSEQTNRKNALEIQNQRSVFKLLSLTHRSIDLGSGVIVPIQVSGSVGSL